MIPGSLFCSTTVAFVGGAFLLRPAFARADVTVVSEVTVSGQLPAPPARPNEAGGNGNDGPPRGEMPKLPEDTRTVTIYYKDKKARKEVSGGGVTLYDGDTGKVYLLDTENKTYRVLSLKEAQDGGGMGGDASVAPQTPGEPMAEMFKTESEAKIRKPKDADTKQIAGLAATRYAAEGSIKLSLRDDVGIMGGMGGERRPGGRGSGFPGGGFPRGGRPGGSGQGIPPELPSSEMQGEFWITDALKLSDNKRVSLLPSVSAALAGLGGPMTKPLMQNLAKTKGFPLSSIVTYSLKTPGTKEPSVVTATTEVKSIREESLPDSLFILPGGYEKEEPADHSARH